MRTLMLLSLLLALAPLHAAERVLRIHGSNTIGAELAPRLVRGWLGEMGISAIEERTLGENERQISGIDRQGKRLVVELAAHGSSTGFRDLGAGLTDIAISSRPIKEKELRALAGLGRLDEPQCEYVLGLDGIAVIVHPDNPLRQLEKRQLKAIFSGTVSDWSQVGGQKGGIHLYARDDQSGTFDTFRSLVLGKGRGLADGARRFESNAELSDAVAQDPHAIGFVGLPYIRHARALAIADGTKRAIAPSALSVATEDYALARRLYLYLPERGLSPLALSFSEFAVAAAGQRYVAESGFVSQRIERRNYDLNAQMPVEYRTLLDGAERLSLNFRFHQGSARLDNKARYDIQRLVAFMAAKENQSRQLILVGFADAHEMMPMRSYALSVQRADQIADVLINEGVVPHKVRGYGAALAVASNEEAYGQQKNRRVEVWLR